MSHQYDNAEPVNPFRSPVNDPIQIIDPSSNDQITQLHLDQVDHPSLQQPSLQQPSLQQSLQPQKQLQQPDGADNTNVEVALSLATPTVTPVSIPTPPPGQAIKMSDEGRRLLQGERCGSCFDMQTYQRFFDVDTVDVWARIQGSITYANAPDHFREQVLGVNTQLGKGPDLFGPIWLCMTLAFLLAASSNVSEYLHSESLDFDNDISNIGKALTLTVTFTFAIPPVLYLACRFLSTPLPLMEIVSIYGYSLVPYIVATPLCIVPFTIFEWFVLAAATALSLLLVLRNTAQPLLDQAGKARYLLIFIISCHFLFFVALKLMFYHHVYHSQKKDEDDHDVDDGFETSTSNNTNFTAGGGS